MTQLSTPAYTSRIIKASALIQDTQVLLSEWDLKNTVAENMDRARRENIFGKASRSRVEDILLIFRQRYFDDPDVGAALVTLAQDGAPAQWIQPLLYFFAAQNDRTLRDMVIEVLYPRQLAGYPDVPLATVLAALRNWTAQGETVTQWGNKTVLRVAQNLMAALRDFGVLQGRINKRAAPVYLPTPSFALLALWLKGHLGSGQRILQSDEWKLFFLTTQAVERFFLEADQMHLLTYSAAGSVVRVEFPAVTLKEYADVLLARAR